MNRIGVVGLGALGGAMAGALLRAGHRVFGFDMDPGALDRFAAAGGTAEPDAAAVAAAADLVLLVVRNEEQVEALLGANSGFLHALRKDAVVWVASTVSPHSIACLGERLAAAGLHLLDGPVSGGVARALAGKLTLILAGNDLAAAAAAPFAPALAEHVFRIASAPGPASAVKAINQLLAASHIAVAAEALALAIRAGIDPEVLQKVVNVSSGASRMFADRAPRMLADEIAPHATLGIFLKDLEIALDAASRLGAAAPVAAAAHGVFARAAAVFGTDVGDPAIFRLYRPGAFERS